MTEVPISAQRLLAIVSASGIGRADISISFTTEPGSAEAYENAIAMIESAGGEVSREVHEFTYGIYETALVEIGTDVPAFRLHGPIGHQAYDQDERVTVTPEAKVALRVIPGGVA